MSKALTARDRSALIRLASVLPKGDENRRAILAGLGRKARLPLIRDAIIFHTQEEGDDLRIDLGAHSGLSRHTPLLEAEDKELEELASEVLRARPSDIKLERVLRPGDPLLRAYPGYLLVWRVRWTGGARKA